jgi:hypothetical protein
LVINANLLGIFSMKFEASLIFKISLKILLLKMF